MGDGDKDDYADTTKDVELVLTPGRSRILPRGNEAQQYTFSGETHLRSPSRSCKGTRSITAVNEVILSTAYPPLFRSSRTPAFGALISSSEGQSN